MKLIETAGKTVRIFPSEAENAPLVVFNAVEDEGESVYAAAKKITDVEFSLAAVSGIRWEAEMSPWSCPPVYNSAKDVPHFCKWGLGQITGGEHISRLVETPTEEVLPTAKLERRRYKGGEPCTGEADAYIETLTKEILPEVLGQLPIKPSYIALAGYSLAGLFAFYALYRTDTFSRAASASGSFWFPDFLEFALKNKMTVQPECVYFSLGDKEAKVRNSMLCTVEDNTRMLNKMCNELGIRSIFELNPGNHFKDEVPRMAKGIAWMIEK